MHIKQLCPHRMSARENISSHELHALLLQLRATDTSPVVDEYDLSMTEAWEKAKEAARKAHKKVVDVLNPKTAEHKAPVEHAKTARAYNA